MMGSRGSAPAPAADTRLQVLALLDELVDLLRSVDVQAELVELRQGMAAIGLRENAIADREKAVTAREERLAEIIKLAKDTRK
jgi:hypothetical protein